MQAWKLYIGYPIAIITMEIIGNL